MLNLTNLTNELKKEEIIKKSSKDLIQMFKKKSLTNLQKKLSIQTRKTLHLK